MATVTVKNIPDDVYQRLKSMAQRHRRSVNSEIIVCLERTLQPAQVRVEDALAAARRLRAGVGGAPFSEDEIRETRRRGRP